ncbi:mitochondrial large ribosomal subunit protein uL30m [Ruminococcaceae bacterium OttesenSCG-928-D13]|nr:mitochondrial large ribosomal subunit protein uL30m [Ruminococcaceae bacterium OttesenSCG-928-D13]
MKRGMAGRTKAQIAVAESLGLRRVGDVSFQPDNGPTAGKIAKVGFLLDVQKS